MHLMEFGNCLSSIENVVEKAKLRLNQILAEATQIQSKDFGGTHNWTLTFEQAFAQHGSYR
jgi:hypothetical protein